ncbi:hypothetical protein Tco_0786927 [Tanacetum coccineum]
MPGCSWRGHLRGVHIHFCPGVLGGDTCEGYIFITARVFLEGTPAMGTYGFHYCPGVLGGDTYDGYIVHRFHELRKKLNLTKPENFKSNISKMTPYTAYKNPQGIIYLDKYKRNRLMRLDELYKFCDGTLTSVGNVLHDIANNLRMEYLPKRRWSNLDRKRSRIMIKATNQQLFERRLMRNLEKFVGGREYEEDFRLLEWTI